MRMLVVLQGNAQSDGTQHGIGFAVLCSARKGMERTHAEFPNKREFEKKMENSPVPHQKNGERVGTRGKKGIYN
jgi:hypothetical protein